MYITVYDIDLFPQIVSLNKILYAKIFIEQFVEFPGETTYKIEIWYENNNCVTINALKEATSKKLMDIISEKLESLNVK